MKTVLKNWFTIGVVSLQLLAIEALGDASRKEVEIQQTGTVPVLRVNVVDRTTTAINYRHRSGATKIDFIGTPLLPQAKGEAKVESKKGYIEFE